MKLTEQEKALLAGSEGDAIRIATERMVDYAEALGVDTLLDAEVVSVGWPCRKPEILNAGQHFDTFEESLAYAALATEEKIDQYPAMRAKKVLTNNGGMTKEWLDYVGVDDPELYECVDELNEFYRTHGINNTCTCAPYLVGNVPQLGAHVVTGESSQVIFENSVLGARTNVEGDIAISCAAISGKIPNSGLHLADNRKGTHFVIVNKIPTTCFEWDIMGYWIGKHVKLGIPVIQIDIPSISFEQYKGFGASMTTAGQIDMFHIIGHTPEAPTYEAAFGGNQPQETFHYGQAEEDEIRKKLNWAEECKVDAVLLGCPHYSSFQVADVAKLVAGKKLQARLIVMTAPTTIIQAKVNGDFQKIEEAGGVLTACCAPMVAIWPEGIKVLATDSGKMAHYVPSTQPFDIHAGDMEQCVEAAINGYWK